MDDWSFEKRDAWQMLCQAQANFAEACDSGNTEEADLWLAEISYWEDRFCFAN